MPTKPKKNGSRLKKEKFDPLAPGIKNKYQLRKSIKRRTQGVIRPKLNALNKQELEETQAHKGRTSDLQGMYGYMGTKLEDAYARASEALNRVLSTTGASNEAAQSAMLAALEQSRSGDRAQATTVGGVLPEGLGDEAAAGAAGAGNASLANIANLFGQNTAMAAGRIGTGALARTRALSSEDARFEAERQQLQQARQGVRQEAPSVREEQRKNILDEELARASESGRQDIARGSLDLNEREASETAQQHDRANAIAWAGINLEKQKIDRAIAGAGSDAEREAAEARGEQYNRGVEVFQRYFENTKKKGWDPQALFRNLTLAVPRDIALAIMKHGPPRFQQYSRKRSGGKGKRKHPLKKGPPAPGEPDSGPYGGDKTD